VRGAGWPGHGHAKKFSRARVPDDESDPTRPCLARRSPPQPRAATSTFGGDGSIVSFHGTEDAGDKEWRREEVVSLSLSLSFVGPS
jgi:hypothetical protein